MNVIFEKMAICHKQRVMDIFNYYIENSTSAFADCVLPYEFYDKILERSEELKSYAIIDDDSKNAIGFCSLNPFNSFKTFNKTATVTYFIDKDFTGMGVGSDCIKKLEKDARQLKISNIIAEIS